MSEQQKRLEAALLKFIERVANEPKSEVETQILPQMAQALLSFWEIN